MPPSVRAPQIAQRREIAARVRAWVDEHRADLQREDPAADYTVRQLSLACGWDGSHLGTVLRRLESGRDTRTETLRTIATQMGRPLAWLETGEMPEGFRLDDDPRWPAAVAAAAERYSIAPTAAAALGRMRVPARPARLDEHVVEKLVRALTDAGALA